MCGIVGVADNPAVHSFISAERRENALTTLAHRGPDGRGQYQHANVWFGHTRLSILDLSAAGDQPMRSADGRFVITYNGEVYNFRALAAYHGLADRRSASDTEVVLRLFAARGVRALAELNGIFAFALYDACARKLWLARDRMGVKPLYFSLNEQRLIFASEMKAILALGAHAPECDVARLHEWLYFGNALGGGTLFRGIRQLPPAHYLELDLSSFSYVMLPYWSLAHRSPGERTPRRAGPVAGETRRLLEQAVQRQLVSDVPVGVFLSPFFGSAGSTWRLASTSGAARRNSARRAAWQRCAARSTTKFASAPRVRPTWSRRWCIITTRRSPMRRTCRSISWPPESATTPR